MLEIVGWFAILLIGLAGGKRSVPIVEVGAPVAGIHSATGVLDVFSALFCDDVLVTMA
ncbi:hypothetical protein BH11ACT6_BH11ACT6_37880 [soil metagenome]